MGRESSDVVRFDLGPLLQGQMRRGSLALESCLSSGYNLHCFSDALGLVFMLFCESKV